MEKKGLGKGLRALIGEPEEFARYETSQWLYLGVDEIEPNPLQPRQSFDEHKLDELAQSLRANGLLQPIIVRRAGAKYQIIAGERRWRAAVRADMLTIPAIVKDATDADMLRMALIENLQRQDLNPIEEATAYRALIEEHSLTQDVLAQYLGKDRSTVANTMRLLVLPAEVQAEVSRGTLSMGHARALLALSDASAQIDLCAQIIREGLSVRQVERMVKHAAPRRRRAPREPDPDIRRLEEDLQRALGTKVRILGAGTRGKIEIEFYSADALDGILAKLLATKDRL
ncbi:MAG: ParB/RepB/Spo0J family partition protein [Candidatus Abyssubacteria bacterium]